MTDNSIGVFAIFCCHGWDIEIILFLSLLVGGVGGLLLRVCRYRLLILDWIDGETGLLVMLLVVHG